MLIPHSHFTSVIYSIDKSEFLNAASSAANDSLNYIENTTEMNISYPSIMSNSLIGDERLNELETFIANAGWSILNNQGYNMDSSVAYVSEFWAQKHLKYSGMEQHVHPYGVLLSGFYFIDCPENGCMVEFHDPRPGKVQASLPIKDESIIREANNSILIIPKPGMMLFANSWLPHSFTRNSSDTPVKFIHFNISVREEKKREAIVI